jgi:tRNA U34 2-thiouridine synthase MnmA/TrmU
VDWLNLAGAKKVHSLVDKIYKMKNLELAWEKVRQNKGAGGIDGESIEAFEKLQTERKAEFAARLNAELDRIDADFEREVVQASLTEYMRGHTPNPCIICNQKIKFDLLLKKCLSLGFPFLATGHYVRNEYPLA